MRGLLRVVSVVLVLGWSVPVLAASDYEDRVRELIKAIVAEAGKLNKQNLAVVDFTDLQGNVTALGRFLAEELSASLVMAGGVQVVDRNQLNKIFQEHSLSMLGISDPEAVQKVGKVAGADALITGSITEMADSVRVTAKVMATDTARVIAAAKTSIPNEARKGTGSLFWRLRPRRLRMNWLSKTWAGLRWRSRVSLRIASISVAYLIQREVPGCEAGGVSRVLRSRTSPARNQLRATPVKAWESTCAVL